MRIVFSFIFVVISLAYFSCNKELHFPTDPTQIDSIPLPPVDPGTPILPSGILVKTISVANLPQDTTVTNYGYDANIHLIETSSRFYVNSSSPATIKYSGKRYYRDALGRIVKIAIRTLSDVPAAVDTQYINVHYVNASSGKVAYTISINAPYNKTVYDSTVYGYDPGNHVDRLSTYSSYDWPAQAPVNYNYEAWTYDNNLQPVKYELFQATDPPGTFALVYRYDFVFDDKVNPFYAVDDVRIDDWIMQHNITSEKFFDASGATSSDMVISYVYDAGNRPVTAVESGSNPISMQYFYSN